MVSKLLADPHCVLDCLWKAMKVNTGANAIGKYLLLCEGCHQGQFPSVTKTSVLNRMVWFEEEEAGIVRSVEVDDADKSTGLEVWRLWLALILVVNTIWEPLLDALKSFGRPRVTNDLQAEYVLKPFRRTLSLVP